MSVVGGAAVEKRIDHYLAKFEIANNTERPHDGDGDDGDGDAGSGAAPESKTDGVKEIKKGVDLLKDTALTKLTTDKEAGAHLLKDDDEAARLAKMSQKVKLVSTSAGAGTTQERRAGGGATGGAGGGGGEGEEDDEEIKETPSKRKKSSVAILAESANTMATADGKSADADLLFAQTYAESMQVSASDQLWHDVEAAKALHTGGILDDDELAEQVAAAKEHFKAQTKAQRAAQL